MIDSIVDQLFTEAASSLRSKKDKSAIKVIEALKENYLDDGLEGISQLMVEMRKKFVEGNREDQ